MNADEYRAMIELAKNAGQRNVKCVDRKIKTFKQTAIIFGSCFLVRKMENIYTVPRFILASKYSDR
jgi:hypothetical protein